MGKFFFDQYSLLHFATGVLAYFWGFNIVVFAVLHALFEIIENSEFGMKIINDFPVWPGGKKEPDSVVNSMGDNVFAIMGFVVAKGLDSMFAESNE